MVVVLLRVFEVVSEWKVYTFSMYKRYNAIIDAVDSTKYPTRV